MTEATVALGGVIILAVLGVIVKVLDYTNKQIMPQLTTLIENVNALKTAHALNEQEIRQNTARLNGQSQKIDTLLLGAPASAPGSAPAPITIYTGGDTPSPVAPAAGLVAADLIAADPPVTDTPTPTEAAKPAVGFIEGVSTILSGIIHKDAPDSPVTGSADTLVSPATVPAPAKINVTVTADHALSADELAAAHAELDAQAKATGGTQ